MVVDFENLWGQSHHIFFEQSVNFEWSMSQWNIPRIFYILHKIMLFTFFKEKNQHFYK
jgi:hypothetical protein